MLLQSSLAATSLHSLLEMQIVRRPQMLLQSYLTVTSHSNTRCIQWRCSSLRDLNVVIAGQIGVMSLPVAMPFFITDPLCQESIMLWHHLSLNVATSVFIRDPLCQESVMSWHCMSLHAATSCMHSSEVHAVCSGTHSAAVLCYFTQLPCIIRDTVSQESIMMLQICILHQSPLSLHAPTLLHPRSSLFEVNGERFWSSVYFQEVCVGGGVLCSLFRACGIKK